VSGRRRWGREWSDKRRRKKSAKRCAIRGEGRIVYHFTNTIQG